MTVNSLSRSAGRAKSASANQTPPRHFLDLDLIDAATLRRIIDAAHELKRAGKRVPDHLRPSTIADDVLVMIFEKPSTRTRISFDVAMRQLGGQSIVLNHNDLQLGRGESAIDTARVISRYIDIIMVRANSHDTLRQLAKHATVPVINGLTDRTHPCQVMADIQTFEEHRGPIEGRKIAWIGDGNNVAASWMHAAVRFNFSLDVACPKDLPPHPEILDWVKREDTKGLIDVMHDTAPAVDNADSVVTDTWVSMGDKDADRRKKLLEPFQVDQALMDRANKDALFMHCLPAYRGHEVTEDVLEGPQSVVFDEAENRLHAQKAILAWCLGAF